MKTSSGEQGAVSAVNLESRASVAESGETDPLGLQGSYEDRMFTSVWLSAVVVIRFWRLGCTAHKGLRSLKIHNILNDNKQVLTTKQTCFNFIP